MAFTLASGVGLILARSSNAAAELPSGPAPAVSPTATRAASPAPGHPELEPARAQAASPPPKHEAPPAGPSLSNSHDIVELSAESGAEWVDVETLRIAPNFVPSMVRSHAWGFVEGVAASMRVLFLTVGPRFRYAHFHDWDLWTLNGELGWNVPLGRVEPSLVVSAGYARIGHAADSNLGLEDGVSIQGYDIRICIGADVRLTKLLSIGALFSGEIMGLTRPEANEPHGFVQDFYNLRSSSIATAATGSLALGLHL